AGGVVRPARLPPPRVPDRAAPRRRTWPADRAPHFSMRAERRHPLRLVCWGSARSGVRSWSVLLLGFARHAGMKCGAEAHDVGEHGQADIAFALAEEGGAGASEAALVEVAALQQTP